MGRLRICEAGWAPLRRSLQTLPMGVDGARRVWKTPWRGKNHRIEPVWKMLLSNKGILPVLWELYPCHPNLLYASFDRPGEVDSWVKKPLLGREGANVTMHMAG